MNLTTKIIAAITSTVVLALTGAIFYVAGQNSELREELSQKSTELTTSKQQVKTLSLIIDQAHDRMLNLKIDATYDRIAASREQQKLWSDLNYCEFNRDFIFREYAPKRLQENMRKAMNAGHTEDPPAPRMIRD